MSARPIPRHVISFLHQYVDHVVKLEFLIAIHAAPSSTTTIPVAARRLDIPKGQVRAMADELAEEGLIRVSSDRLELWPASIEDRCTISDLASSYRHDKDAILAVLNQLGRA